VQAGRTNGAWNDMCDPGTAGFEIESVKQHIECWCDRAVFNAAGCPLPASNTPLREGLGSADFVEKLDVEQRRSGPAV